MITALHCHLTFDVDTMTIRTLLVDSDFELCGSLRAYLGRYGIEVSVLVDQRRLEKRLELERPDIIVLDVSMPGVDGLMTMRQLRASGNDIPVIMLSACMDDTVQIAGLDLGADDYIRKPLNPRELLARIRAILRRSGALPSLPGTLMSHKLITFCGFSLDSQNRTLRTDSQTQILPPREFGLLKIFVEQPMCVFTRGALIRLMHGLDGEQSCRGVDVLVWRLRKSLESSPSSPQLIQTVRGYGYVFVPDGHGRALSEVRVAEVNVLHSVDTTAR